MDISNPQHPLNIANPVSPIRLVLRAAETPQKPMLPPQHPRTQEYTEEPPADLSPAQVDNAERISGMLAVGLFLVCTILLVLFMRQEHQL